MSATAFEYRAVDRAGQRTAGVERAASEREAYRQLSAKGLTPVSLREARDAGGVTGARGRGGRIPLKELAHFTAQLGMMLDARIQLSDGLLAIAEQESDARLRAVILDIAGRMQSGQTLADAMGGHSRLFGEVYIACLRAAEQTGTLSGALELLAQMLERQQELRQRVVGALMYPMCVVAMLIVAVGFLVGYVVPKFAKMFATRGVELPLITRMLADAGESVQGYWYLYLGVIVGGGFGLMKAWRTPGGRRVLEAGLHRVPKIGGVLQGLAVARFSRVLGLCLGSGLGLIDSLELAGRAGGRAALRADVQKLMTQVRVGGRLTEVMSGCPYMPGFARRMFAAGEATAELPKMCVLVARHYERESEYTAKNLSTLIEPLLIVAITGVVLVVALAIFLPMWDMAKLVG